MAALRLYMLGTTSRMVPGWYPSDTQVIHMTVVGSCSRRKLLPVAGIPIAALSLHARDDLHDGHRAVSDGDGLLGTWLGLGVRVRVRVGVRGRGRGRGRWQ